MSNKNLPSEKALNIIRGKSLVGAVTKDEVNKLLTYIDFLVEALDSTDDLDTFGTEGWRKFFGAE